MNFKVSEGVDESDRARDGKTNAVAIEADRPERRNDFATSSEGIIEHAQLGTVQLPELQDSGLPCTNLSLQRFHLISELTYSVVI